MGDYKKSGVSRCTAYCNGCHYRKAFNGGDASLPYCDYICMVGKHRPCPAGDGCTVWTEKTTDRGRVRTQEERDALTQMHIERRRKRQREWDRKRKAEMSPEERERRKAARRAYYHANKDRINATRKAWAETNKEKLQKQARERYQKRREAE